MFRGFSHYKKVTAKVEMLRRFSIYIKLKKKNIKKFHDWDKSEKTIDD